MNALTTLPLTPDGYERAEISFGEWLADLPRLNNPGAVEALNVIPVEGGYVPFASHAPEENVIPETVRGATSAVLVNDVVQVYAGSVAGLYTKMGGAPFTNLLAVSSSENHNYKFIRVNEQMVILHREHFPLRQEVGTLDAPVTVGGTPPRASCGAQVGDFLMLGDLLEDPDDSGDAFPSRVRWGGFNNIDSPWVTDPATQADFQDMPAEGGAVVAIAGREYGTIYQERMISRASYRGPPSIFDFVTLEDKRGCIARDAVVDVGAYQFFIAEDGFFRWNGVNSEPISDSRVTRYFFNRLQYGRRSRIVGAADFVNGCVHWAFPTSTDGTLDEIISYSYRENRWSHTQIEVEALFNSAFSNLTAEELDEAAESYLTSFDDALFTSGGRTILAGFDTSHAYGLFNGLPLAATIDTGEYSGPNGRRVFVNNSRPLVDLASPLATMQIAYRDQLIGDVLEFTDPVPQELDGQCPVMADARYMRFRLNIPAGIVWRHAIGVEISRKAAGTF